MSETIRETRSCAGQEATGIVTAAGEADDELVALAGARARRELTQRLIEAGAWVQAMQCARAGLDEIGPLYRTPGERDPTRSDLLAVDEHLKADETAEAVQAAAEVLDQRIAMLAGRLADRLAE